MAGREQIYEHTDIPPGVTLAEYRRSRVPAPPQRGRRARLRLLLRRRVRRGV